MQALADRVSENSKSRFIDRGECSRRIDLTDPVLRARIEVQRVYKSEVAKKDIGSGAAFVDYGTDNPSFLPHLEDKTSPTSSIRHWCKLQQETEAVLLPIAVLQHQYLMGINMSEADSALGRVISSTEAWIDFRDGFYKSWEERKFVSTCMCLCPDAETCPNAQRAYRELFSREEKNLPLIPTSPEGGQIGYRQGIYLLPFKK